MARKVISYKLEQDGSIPHFVEDGGYFSKDANDTASMICLGISKDGADLSNAIEVFDDISTAVSYVQTYMSDNTTIDPFTGQESVFVVSEAVTDLFNKIL